MHRKLPSDLTEWNKVETVDKRISGKLIKKKSIISAAFSGLCFQILDILPPSLPSSRLAEELQSI